MLLLRGVAQGLVYSSFNEDIHVKHFREEDLAGWRAFAGIDLRTNGRIVVLFQSPEIMENGKKMTWVVDEWYNDSSTPSIIRRAAFDMREDLPCVILKNQTPQTTQLF